MPSSFRPLQKEASNALVIVAPNWWQELELMCDANDYALGEILGYKRNGRFHAIDYARKVLNRAQINYTTTEREMLAVVYDALEKF